MLSWVGESFCLRILQALEAGEKTVGELVAFSTGIIPMYPNT